MGRHEYTSRGLERSPNRQTILSDGFIYGTFACQNVCNFDLLQVLNQPLRSTQPGHLSLGKCNKYQQKLVSKQARWHSIRGIAV